ncbi:MAG: D-aminoacylase [Candidatus Desantisbacteria bacterium]
MIYDLLIKNAEIFDGTKNSGYKADIGVKGERIVKIGIIDAPSALMTIDATDRVVCPGFIDMHSHSDFTILANPRSESKIRQGVTTEVIGNCGMSAAPRYEEALKRGQEICHDFGFSCNWKSMADYFKVLEDTGIGINIVALVGQGNIRTSVMGYVDSIATDIQLSQMKSLLEESLCAGCFGMSSGLIYPPGCFTPMDELVELCKIVAEFNGIYTTHMRSEGDQLLEAIDEALTIGKESGVHVNISHLKTSGQRNWHKLQAVFDKFDTGGQTQGQTHRFAPTIDRYPYTAGGTGLDAVLPSWMYEGGTSKEIERLKDVEIRNRLILQLAQEHQRDWDTVMISSVSNKANKCWEGKRLSELMQGNIELLFDFLISEECKTEAIFFSMSEDNLQQIMKKPYMMIGSDASSRATYGILAQEMVHPRGFGTFPRVLSHFVRKEKILSMEEAIWKMTLLPANTLGLCDRGQIKEGYFADMVIFDPITINDTATYELPLSYPTGIDCVILNGQIVVRNGECMGKACGKVLRKG